MIASYGIYASTPHWHYWLGAAIVMAGITIVAPGLLTYPNRMWGKLGVLMSKVISPVVMGLLFYVIITPIAVFMRLIGKDLLSLKWHPEAKSYWIVRDPPGTAAESLRNKF